jgi:hypothetical protein
MPIPRGRRDDHSRSKHRDARRYVDCLKRQEFVDRRGFCTVATDCFTDSATSQSLPTKYASPKSRRVRLNKQAHRRREEAGRPQSRDVKRSQDTPGELTLKDAAESPRRDKTRQRDGVTIREPFREALRYGTTTHVAHFTPLNSLSGSTERGRMLDAYIVGDREAGGDRHVS